MMPPQDEQVEQLFHQALAHPESARVAFLAEACADKAVRHSVERLLCDYERAGNFLNAPVWEAAAKTLAAKPVEGFSGRRLNHYQLLSLLGKGGMGEVYLAEDTRLDRKVALKFLPAEILENSERRRRFRREAKAASALNHPNILTIYEFGDVATESGEVHFIASEFVSGCTLRVRLAEGALPLAEALDIGLQIARALSAAHAAGIIHRDLKPENVMVRPDGLVKVLDFGLAKLMEGQSDKEEKKSGEEEVLLALSPDHPNHDFLNSYAIQSQTQPGAVMGTPPYMSPEQARGLEVDARTDIFSFGVVLYEMLVGKRPFAETDLSTAIAGALEVERSLFAQSISAVPRGLEKIVSRAMREDPADRYANISEMCDELKAVKQRLDNQVSLRKRRQWNLVAVTVLMALVVGMIYFLQSSRAKDERDGAASLNSIAVMPFMNRSQDPNTEYLSDGVSESLINQLAQLPGLKVIARGSSFRYKGKNADPRQVGQALGVATLLTGSIRQNAEQIFIEVELMDARNLTRLWGAQYQQHNADLSQIQSKIVSEIAATLHLGLTEGVQQQLIRNGASHPQAYELVLKGRFFRGKGTPESRKKALEYFQQAITIEPNYALAWAELGNFYSSLMNVGEMSPPEAMSKARSAAEQALALDRNLLEAHYTLANCKLDQWDWAGAADEFRHIIELNPNSARTLSGYAFVLVYTGKFDSAVEAARRARDLDPVSLGMNTRLGQVLYFVRRYEEALGALQKVLEMDQHYNSAHIYIGRTSAALGRNIEAIDAYQEARKLLGNPPYLQIYLGAAYANAGARSKAVAIRNQLRAAKEYVSPAEIAILHAALGDRDAALQALEQAYAAHDAQMQFLKVEPGYDSLRAEPRFQEMLRRMGFN